MTLPSKQSNGLPIKHMIAFLAALLAVAFQTRADEPPKVLVSIKPLALIAAAITDTVTTPDQLLEPGTSPHDYALRPSDVRKLATADIVFWVGEDLETFLRNPLDHHVDKKRSIALMESPNVQVENFLSADKEDVEQALKRLAASHGHEHGLHDPHIWLGPDNAMAIARTMMQSLSEIDQKNASTYQSNYLRFVDRLKATDAANQEMLKDLHNQGFFVFHDAWGYFTRHYGLHVIDVFTISPELSPGARHMVELRQELVDAGHTCVFREPQFRPAYLDTMINNLNVKVGVIDPLATDYDLTPDAYTLFLENKAITIRDCLVGSGT